MKGKKDKFLFVFFGLLVLVFIFSTQKAEATVCPVSASGNYTLTSSCIISAGGGMHIVNGSLTINAGVTLTMDTNARLTIGPGYSIFANGSISMASGARIEKKSNQIVLNSVTGQACNVRCPAGFSCVSIGQDAFGTDTYWWSASSCSFGSCVDNIGGNCVTVMSDQCGPGTAGGFNNNTCCAIEVHWTRCLCIEN